VVEDMEVDLAAVEAMEEDSAAQVAAHMEVDLEEVVTEVVAAA
jgi:aconitase B